MPNEKSINVSLLESLRWGVKAAKEDAAHHAMLAAYPESDARQHRRASYRVGYSDGMKRALDICLDLMGNDKRHATREDDPEVADILGPETLIDSERR